VSDGEPSELAPLAFGSANEHGNATRSAPRAEGPESDVRDTGHTVRPGTISYDVLAGAGVARVAWWRLAPVGAGNSVTSLTCEFGWCSRLTGSLCEPVRVARPEVLLLFTRSVLPRANREIT
jgi:hypothetical protein